MNIGKNPCDRFGANSLLETSLRFICKEEIMSQCCKICKELWFRSSICDTFLVKSFKATSHLMAFVRCFLVVNAIVIVHGQTWSCANDCDSDTKNCGTGYCLMACPSSAGSGGGRLCSRSAWCVGGAPAFVLLLLVWVLTIRP